MTEDYLKNPCEITEPNHKACFSKCIANRNMWATWTQGYGNTKSALFSKYVLDVPNLVANQTRLNRTKELPINNW